MNAAMRIQVECYAGHRGEETPRWLQIGDRRLEVVAILDRWLAPEHRYFKCEQATGPNGLSATTPWPIGGS